MSDPRYEIAKIVAAARFEDLRDIAASLHDMADDLNMLQPHVNQINVVEFIYDWARSVLEYEEDAAKEAGE